jgi:hypothetical protein
MPARAHPSWFTFVGASLSLLACTTPAPVEAPAATRTPSPAPVLSADDEALLASLLTDDPGDFHVERARIWRLGAARWIAGGPELPNRPSAGPRSGALERPLAAVVVEPEGPRLLLPLDELTGPTPLADRWSALRIVAVLSPGDLVAGLRRELRPTPWLTLAAGVALTPREREDDHLEVRWSDPACGFGLELVIDSADFGPLYEPGPSGPPSDPPEPPGTVARRLAPGTAIFASPDAREPILRLDPETPSHGERLSAAQRVSLEGKPSRGRQAVTLRCRGVEIRGFVAARAIVENTARYAVVEDAPERISSCAGIGGEAITVPRATPLYEPTGDSRGALVGVVADEIDLPASPGVDGWWTSCVPSPWGDLVFQFRLR